MIPAFLEMAIARHESAKRGYLVYGALLIGAGAVLLVLGLGLLSFWPWGATGVAALAVSVFAFRNVVERRERIEGLEVLREEWQDMPAKEESEALRFLDLIKKLY